MRKLIRQLSDMRAISGSEYRINEKLRDMFLPYADEVVTDSLGNVAAKRECKKKGAPTLMVEAHCDEIGLIVTDIDKKGFVTFGAVGGIDRRILPSSVVTIHGKKDIKGVVGIKPSEFLESKKAVKMSDMAIDCGMSAENLKKYISVGDGITLPQSVGALGKKQFSGKTLDDRASVAALLAAMKKLKDKELNINLVFCAHVQEEVGTRGAKTSAFGLNPDMAIAIDVTHAITPDNSENAFKAGEGITISVGPNIHPAMAKRLIDTADRHGIKYAVEVDGGDTGTDAWAIQNVRRGIPTALFSIPLKYMHTSVETLCISDVKALVRLLVKFIEEQEGDIKWLTF